MRGQDYQVKRDIIIATICIFILAPFMAWLLSRPATATDTPQKSVTPATTQEILYALEEANEELPDPQKQNKISKISSLKRIGNWWYIAKVKLDTGSTGADVPVILVKFSNNTPIKVITKPGAQLRYVNISGGQGVPYNVIDDFNKAYSEYNTVSEGI